MTIEQPTIREVFDLVNECNTKVTKMLDGLYGTIDKPGTGFIADTNKRLNNLEDRKNERQWLMRVIMGTTATFLITAALALVGAFLGKI